MHTSVRGYHFLHNNFEVQSSDSFRSIPVDNPELSHLVKDGTKCGEGRVCLSQQCVAVFHITRQSCGVGTNGQTCSGNGVS